MSVTVTLCRWLVTHWQAHPAFGLGQCEAQAPSRRPRAGRDCGSKPESDWAWILGTELACPPAATVTLIMRYVSVPWQMVHTDILRYIEMSTWLSPYLIFSEIYQNKPRYTIEYWDIWISQYVSVPNGTLQYLEISWDILLTLTYLILSGIYQNTSIYTTVYWDICKTLGYPIQFQICVYIMRYLLRYFLHYFDISSHIFR